MLESPKAFTDWMTEEAPDFSPLTWPHESYTGQESAVVNIFENEELSHPLVNPLVTEEACHNKFFLHQLMKDSEVKEHIIPSALVGLGFSHEVDLEKVLGTNQEEFVIKPIKGSLGKGFRMLSRKRAEEYRHSRGAANSSLTSIPIHIEDMVEKEDFEFEYGLALLQPFVNGRRTFEGAEVYTSIRSIVCNERFVDAYVRASHGQKVNLSQGAKAYPCENKEEIAVLSEKMVTVFEEACVGYDAPTFKLELYRQYIGARGKTTKEMRERERAEEMVQEMGDVVFSFLYQLR